MLGGGEAVELGESPEGFYCPGEKKCRVRETDRGEGGQPSEYEIRDDDQ